MQNFLNAKEVTSHSFSILNDNRSECVLTLDGDKILFFEGDRLKKKRIFDDEKALDAYLIKRKEIDTWVVYDQRSEKEKISYKHYFDGEIENFYNEDLLNRALSLENEGLWRVNVIKDKKCISSIYILAVSSYFSQSFLKFSTEEEVLAAYKNGKQKNTDKKFFLISSALSLLSTAKGFSNSISSTVSTVSTVSSVTYQSINLFPQWAVDSHNLAQLFSSRNVFSGALMGSSLFFLPAASATVPMYNLQQLSDMTKGCKYSQIKPFTDLPDFDENILAEKDDEGNILLNKFIENGCDNISGLLLNFSSYRQLKSQNNKGDTPAHLIARKGHNVLMEKVLNEILSGNYDASLQNKEGDTVLLTLIKNKYFDFVGKIIEKGGKHLDMQDAAGNTALHLLVDLLDRDTHNLIPKMLKASANINIKNKDGLTSLHMAILQRKPWIASLLITDSVMSVLDDEGNSILHYMAQYNVNEYFDSFTSSKKTLLDLVIQKNGNLNIKNKKNERPIDVAVSVNNNDFFGVLMDKGANIDHSSSSKGNSVLAQAIATRDETIIKKIVDRVDKMAANNVDETEKKNNILNTKDSNGKSLVCFAIEQALSNSAVLLIDAGVDLGLVDDQQNNAAHYAIKYRNYFVLESLISKGNKTLFTSPNKQGVSAYELSIRQYDHTAFKKMDDKYPDIAKGLITTAGLPPYELIPKLITQQSQLMEKKSKLKLPSSELSLDTNNTDANVTKPEETLDNLNDDQSRMNSLAAMNKAINPPSPSWLETILIWVGNTQYVTLLKEGNYDEAAAYVKSWESFFNIAMTGLGGLGGVGGVAGARAFLKKFGFFGGQQPHNTANTQNPQANPGSHAQSSPSNAGSGSPTVQAPQASSASNTQNSPSNSGSSSPNIPVPQTNSASNVQSSLPSSPRVRP